MSLLIKTWIWLKYPVEDINRDKAHEIIIFVLEGISSKYMQLFKGHDASEALCRMETLRRSIMKTFIY
jgi:hypothetical protein